MARQGEGCVRADPTTQLRQLLVHAARGKDLTAKQLEKAAAQREKEEAAYEKVKRKRFIGFEQRSEKIGTAHVLIEPRPAPPSMIANKEADSEWDGMTAGYDGPAAIWATKARNQSIMYRAQPHGWKGPCQIVKLADVRFSTQFPTQGLAQRLEKKADECNAFEHAEQADEYALSKIEADLVARFQKPPEKAVAFVKYAGWLARETGEPNRWPKQSQENGVVLTDKLQARYGLNRLPSREALSLGARHLYAVWPITPAWFLKDKDYIDVYLFLCHDYVYERRGTVKKRRYFKNTPLDNEPVAFDLDLFNELVDAGISKACIIKPAELKECRKIANRESRTKRVVGLGRVEPDEELRPGLSWRRAAMGITRVRVHYAVLQESSESSYDATWLD
ncbi:hypothetical protein LTR65_001829 [Meristemomyces frigidus]